MKLAEIALQTEKRQALLDRQKKLSREGQKFVQAWIARQGGLFSIVPPAATSIAFIRYHLDMPSLEFAELLRKNGSVLVAPGGFLGTEHHFRISIGYPAERLEPSLSRIAEVTHAAQQHYAEV
jgi:aspartate/methionine/tyrosine aminotransferase